MRNLTRIVGSNGATRKTVIAMKDEADGRNQLWKDADLRHAEVGRPDTMSDETYASHKTALNTQRVKYV